MNRIADVERGYIDGDFVRQIARQTFDREDAQVLLQQTAEILYASGHSEGFQRHVGLNFLVH